MPQLGPHSRVIDRGSLGQLDGRSREGRFLRTYDAMLTKHLGGKPSRVQREIIRRCARLALHLELADEKALIRGEEMSACGARSYVTWHRALMSALRQLGIDELPPPPPRIPTVKEILAEQARAA